MKKLLLLVIILGAAGGWGYFQGSENIKPAGTPAASSPAPQKSLPERVLSDITSSVSDLSSHDDNSNSKAQIDTSSADQPKPAGRSDSTVQDIQKTETSAEKIQDLRNFREALESRVHRDQFVPLSEMPAALKDAIITTEDKRYYSHGAVDPIGIVRAMFINYKEGKTVEGGSTIAQQTVKNIFLSNERTAARKLEELGLAIQLERNYTKDQILELYLNTIYFGHGAYGIKEASETYFHKKPKDLNLAQCAMLAGLPQAPSLYDPLSHPKEGMSRMETVLSLMENNGLINQAERDAAPKNLWNRN